MSQSFFPSESLPGFRLHRLELYNWGTFHEQPWTIDLQGETALLTGANGSGKSTLVDALLTLLVPNQKRNYNQAAGDGRRERDETSYVRGAYGRVQSDAEYAARVQYLRDESSYSVLLAHFRNAAEGRDVTLAQLFWLSNGVQKFFVVAQRPLTIIEHFQGADSMRALKSRLKAMQGVDGFDHFSAYSKSFRKLVGLRSDKALDLFNQTVTIKEIGALNDFVRHHMLESTNALDKVRELQAHYQDLMLAYAAIQKAERQLRLLRPVAEEARRYEESQREIAALQGCEAAVPIYFAGRKLQLLQKALHATQQQVAARTEAQQQERATLNTLREKQEGLTAAIASDEVGQRLRELEQAMRVVQQERDRRQAEARRYDDFATLLGLPTHRDAATFAESRRRAEQAQRALADEQRQRDDQRIALSVALERLRQQQGEVEAELASLRSRTSQIPGHNVALRDRLLKALDIPDEAVPFVGELLRVRDGEERWEGAIERLLHPFALCLLVPERHYPPVRDYVNQTDLRGRLVFYRVDPRQTYPPRADSEPHDLSRKLLIKPESLFYDWLADGLRERYSFLCCESVAQFERARYALTPEGLIKRGHAQHEKDDRHPITDRRRYVLGWTNVDKIAALEAQQQQGAAQVAAHERHISALMAQQQGAVQRAEQLRDLLAFEQWSALDWQRPQQQWQALEEERQALEASSDHLKLLRQQRDEMGAQIRRVEQSERRIADELSRARLLSEQHQADMHQCRRELSEADDTAMQQYAPQIQQRIQQEIALAGVDELWRTVARDFREQAEVAERRRSTFLGRLLRAMQAYKSDFPAESVEFDASPEAIPAFEREWQRIEGDDLPQHRARFKGMMDEKIIHHISILRADLEQYEEAVRSSIADLNRSLRRIDYTTDTYIELKSEPTHDVEIRDFRQALRDCLMDVGQRDEGAYERSFTKIKALIQRFQEEWRWTQKVTDVRNWLNFAAVERYRADDSEKHYYSDSSGKSGGQKAKLAYTILASAIAFQFGLEEAEARARSLRFVAVDEAFSRSDENNARYAMQLFRELGLQLLVVTPMTGTHIVEPFIATCHFVWNNAEGNDSRVATLTLNEMRAQRTDYQEAQRALARTD